MISLIRRRLKSKAARSILLWVIIIALAAGFLLIPGARKDSRRWIAKVNGVEVPYLDFFLKFKINERAVRMLRMNHGSYANMLLSAMGLLNPKVKAFQQVVQQELLDQEAKRLSISLNPDFITKQLADFAFLQRTFPFMIPQEVVTPTFELNVPILRYALSDFGLSLADFEAMAEQALKREIVLDVVSGAVDVPEFEMKQKYMLDYLARKFEIITFEFNSFLKEAKAKELSKAEIKQFYTEENKSKKRYWVPEKRAGVASIFDAKSFGVTTDEDEIKNYYEDNKMRKFVQKPAEVQVRRILFKVEQNIDSNQLYEKAKKVHSELLLEPSKFADFAKELSQDSQTAETGGLIPFFARGTRNREFEKASFILKADGDISDVIQTDEGFEIVQRVARKSAAFKPLKEVESEIKEALIQKKFGMLFTKEMNEIIQKTGVDQEKLKQVLNKRNKEHKIALQVKNDDRKIKALFGIRDGIPTFYVEGEKGIVVTLTERQKRHLPTIDAVEDIVKNDLYEKRASSAMDDFLKKVKKEYAAGSFDEIKKAYHDRYTLRQDQTGWIKQNDTEKIAALRSKGYPVDQMLRLEKVGSTAHMRAGAGQISDGYLVKIEEIEEYNDQEYMTKKNELKKELLKNANDMYKEDFIAFLRKKATIKVNTEIISL